MPRRAKGPRLYLDPGERTWIIRDGPRKRRTGCGEGDRQGAEVALQEWIAAKYRPAGRHRPDQVLVVDALTFYGREVAPRHRAGATTSYAIDRLEEWWGDRPLSDVRRSTCQAYVEHRMSQARPQAKTPEARGHTVSSSTARRELGVLAAAIAAYHAEHVLDAVPVVTLPPPAPARERWLTREEAARFLLAARRHPERPARTALIRFFLVAVYTGTRSGAIRTLGWLPSTAGGWIDVEAGVMHRRPAGARETRKRTPPLRIPVRLLGHLRRWRAADQATGSTRVIHHHGAAVASQRKAWAWARKEAGLGTDVVAHVARHTAATWMMQGGESPWDAAGFLGMSPETLWTVYGHHHPDWQRDLAARIGRGERRA